MAYIPKPLNPEWTGWDIPDYGGTVPAITVYALRENKRPIGFAPWPEPVKPKPKKRKKKAA